VSAGASLCTTDDLVKFWRAAAGDLPEAQIEAAIPAAIDALYSNRDSGGNMHSAGAACAIAALRASRDAK
jgi:hypothetical protein